MVLPGKCFGALFGCSTRRRGQEVGAELFLVNIDIVKKKKKKRKKETE